MSVNAPKHLIFSSNLHSTLTTSREMATAILPSHDCLRNSLTSNVSCSRSHRNRRSGSDRSRSTVSKLPAQDNLVTDKVRILKRGEAVPLYFFIKKDQKSEKLKGASASNIDPDDVAFFAGWACFASPPPSLVPLPRFLANNVHQ